MDKLKEILKFILGILSAVIGILVIKKMNHSDKLEDAVIKVESKDEVLKENESKIDEKINNTKEKLNDKPKDLSDEEVVEFWKDKV